MPGPPLTFREIAFGSPEYRLECRLRDEVLRKPLGLSLYDEDRAREEKQLHFGLFEPNGDLVACAVAAPLSPTEAQIRQMAVFPSQRGKGLGRSLLMETEADLRSRGFRSFVLNARISAVGFYEKLGYAVVGDEFVRITVPHFRMEKGPERAPDASSARLPFDLQPTLVGELLELRPLRAADFDDLFAVAADPLIWEQHPVRDRYEEEVFRAFFEESLSSGGALAALDSKDRRIIGSSRFHGYDPARSEVEIGWTFLARSHWGGAYNGEMKRLMLRHAFRFVDRVVLLCGPQNLRSRRAVEKIGGVPAGRRLDAGGRESILYEITAREYARRGDPGASRLDGR